MLAAASQAHRAFDAVVIGEYERVFYGDQFREVVSRLNELGVQVWLPEAGGPVELDSPVHQALMVLLGAQAQREVARARQRVLAAMRTQTSQQGRFLGGRPSYGYRLVDGGPHPNARHSGWGRRLQVLAPDPVTAPWVRWMFRERARGRALASIVRELNIRGVPCPSSADPGRNSHRTGARWMVTAVAAILENPAVHGQLTGVRQYILAAIHHAGRRVRILGTTAHATAEGIVGAGAGAGTAAAAIAAASVLALALDGDIKGGRYVHGTVAPVVD